MWRATIAASSSLAPSLRNAASTSLLSCSGDLFGTTLLLTVLCHYGRSVVPRSAATTNLDGPGCHRRPCSSARSRFLAALRTTAASSGWHRLIGDPAAGDVHRLPGHVPG